MTAPRVYPTPVLWHLRQRHLLDAYLLAHASAPAQVGAMLDRLLAAPDGSAATDFGAEELAFLQELQLISAVPPPPRSARLPFVFVQAVNFELTYSCNLACSHCLQDGLRPSGPALWPSFATLERVLEEARLLGLTRAGMNVTGGEIFLAGSPVLELLATAAACGIPSRANTNAWWGDRGPITIGTHHVADDAAVVAALRQRNLGRLALSLDGRYRQYPDVLDRVIRVATLCERAAQPYEVVATEPDAATARLAEQKPHTALGHPPRHLRLTPMDTVDIGAAALHAPPQPQPGARCPGRTDPFGSLRHPGFSPPLLTPHRSRRRPAELPLRTSSRLAGERAPAVACSAAQRRCPQPGGAAVCQR